MVTQTIDIREARSRLPELLGLAIMGTEVIVMASDTPLARLSPMSEGKQRIAGLSEGAAWISDDFDDPLPDEFWLGEERDSYSIPTHSCGGPPRLRGSRGRWIRSFVIQRTSSSSASRAPGRYKSSSS